MLLVENLKAFLNLNFFHYLVLSYLTQKSLGYKIGKQFNNIPIVVGQRNYTTKSVNVTLSMTEIISQKFCAENLH